MFSGSAHRGLPSGARRQGLSPALHVWSDDGTLILALRCRARSAYAALPGSVTWMDPLGGPAQIFDCAPDSDRRSRVAPGAMLHSGRIVRNEPSMVGQAQD